MSVASDECYTPAEYVRLARAVLGRFDLDPATSVHAQRVVRAKRFYTRKTDGLSKRWRGRVWLNFPYSEPAVWVNKLIESYEAGDVTAAIVLCNARPGTAWFQALARIAWRCEKRKRISFWGPATGKAKHGWMDSVFFYLGDNPDRFRSVFSEMGTIVPPSLTVTKGATQGCVMCGRDLSGHRVGAETCSSPCRQKRYRQKARSAA